MKGELTRERADELSKLYDVGAWRDWPRTPFGNTNLTFFVTADAGEFALRVSRDKKSESSLRSETSVLAFLNRYGYPAPEPVPTRSGDAYARVDDTFYLLTRRMSGTGYDPDNPRHLEEAGHGLGRAHRILADYDGPTAVLPAPSLLTLAERAGSLGQAQEHATRHLDAEGSRRLADALDYARERIREVRGPIGGLPRIMIHGSYRHSSLLFQGDRLAGVVDFDRTNHELRARDVACGLLSFSTRPRSLGGTDPHPLNPARCGVFMRAYRAAAPVPEPEVERLPECVEAYRLTRVVRHCERILTKKESEKRSRKFAASIEQEAGHLEWLKTHRADLRAALMNGGA